MVAVDNQQNATTSNAVSITVNSPVWSHADVGAVGQAGSDSYNPANSQYTINGAGAGVTGTADAFRFLYVSLSGNFTITAKVDSFNGTATNAGAGVMVRQSTAAGAIEASLLFKSYSNQVKFNRRTTSQREYERDHQFHLGHFVLGAAGPQRDYRAGVQVQRRRHLDAGRLRMSRCR